MKILPHEKYPLSSSLHLLQMCLGYMCVHVHVLSLSVQGVKTTQMNVNLHLQRGRVHCTLAADHVTQVRIM